MSKEKKIKEFKEDWWHFCKKLNLAHSALDNRAIVFMNEFERRLEDLVKEE